MTAWDLTGAVYTGKSKSVAAQEAAPNGLAFGDGGSKFYVIGANQTVYQYELSTPWDVTTAVYASKSFSVASLDLPRGVAFRSDGSSMYVTDTSGGGYAVVQQYDLLTPWDVTTAVFASKLLDVYLTNVVYGGVFFKPDGLQIYVTGGAAFGHTVQQALGTAWDLSTGITPGTVEVITEDLSAFAGGVVLSPDGSKMFLLSAGALAGLYQYTLTTPWDLSSEDYDVVSFSVASEESSPRGLAFSDDGTKFYVVGPNADAVYQYQVATGGWAVGRVVF